MSIVLPTNLPGGYQFTDFSVDRIQGYIGSYQFDDMIFNTRYYAESYKSETIHGNHTSPYHYYRAGSRIVTDNPSENRYKEYYDGKLRSDYRTTRHISRDFPTMFMAPPPRFFEDLANCRSASISKARLALQGEGAVSNGADLAEARQTANLLADGTKDLLRAARAMRKGDIWAAMYFLGLSKADKSDPRKVAQLLLTLDYGWKPLIRSVHDNYKKLTDDSPDPLTILSERTGGKVSLSETTENSDFVMKWDMEGNSRCEIKARVDHPGIRNGDQYGLINPASIAWEVTPFSFVFDWVIPIGSLLASLTSTAGLQFESGYVTQKWTSRFTAYRKGWDTPGLMVIEGFDVSREPFNGFPMPQLYGKTNPFTTQHISDALALIYANA